MFGNELANQGDRFMYLMIKSIGYGTEKDMGLNPTFATTNRVVERNT